MCCYVICIFTLCAIFNLSIFENINVVFVLYIYTGEMNICESELLIHLFEPKVITTGDEVGIMARAMYGTLQEFQPDVEPIKVPRTCKCLLRGEQYRRRQASASTAECNWSENLLSPAKFDLACLATREVLQRIGNYSPVAFPTKTVKSYLLQNNFIFIKLRTSRSQNTSLSYVVYLRIANLGIHSTMLSETDSFVECATQVHRSAYLPKLT